MVYSLVLPTLISLWHISKGEAGLLGTSALLLSSLGGWLAGLAADRYGRVKVLQLTILWFAFFTFLSGFAHGFTQLLIFRGLQGLGFGGEWSVGSVLIGETIRSEYRGRAVGTVQGGWAIGWGISALFYTLFFAVLPSWLAWRAMFWVGLLPALLAFCIACGPGCAGWLSCDHHMAAVIFDRARPFCDPHWWILIGGDCRVVRRISDGGSPGRQDRPQVDANPLRGSIVYDGAALHRAAYQRPRDVAARLPSRILSFWRVQPDGSFFY